MSFDRCLKPPTKIGQEQRFVAVNRRKTFITGLHITKLGIHDFEKSMVFREKLFVGADADGQLTRNHV